MNESYLISGNKPLNCGFSKILMGVRDGVLRQFALGQVRIDLLLCLCGFLFLGCEVTRQFRCEGVGLGPCSVFSREFGFCMTAEG